jgi:hypothetical protein
MEGQFILSAIPIDQLRDLITEVIRGELATQAKNDLQEKLLTASEARKLFVPAITVQTLYNWTKKGLLPVHFLNNRNYYKYSEVIAAAKTVRRYSQSVPKK